jgi:hypothetical protein
MSTPTGITLRVTDKNGKVSEPSYEAYGWDKINAVIQGTLEIEHVVKVEIADIGFTREGN